MPAGAGLKLGLIAGGGALPVALAEGCMASGRPLYVLRLRGFGDPELQRFPGVEVGIAELGRTFDLLRREGCEAVCLAGQVKRPDFAALKPDLRGLRALPAAVAAARKGDDALLRFLVQEFEREGFAVEGADQVHAGLTLPRGPLGRHAPKAEHQGDLDQALAAAQAIGALDIGQAVVAAGGMILAVEAQEGTDAMLARCLTLPAVLRGSAEARAGVLVKWPKPIQERRVDLPVLGRATVEAAAAVGLAGIAGQAGGLLVLQRQAVIESADRLGLFVVGL